MTSKFRSKIWDPHLIVSQIVSMQFQFYTSLLLINYLLNKLINKSSSENQVYSLNQIFDHRFLNFQNSYNTFLCLSFISNALLRYIFKFYHNLFG
jgi:hypothetical protein